MNELVENKNTGLNQFPQEKIALLKSTICKGASDLELQFFIHVCAKTGLDPFLRQIYSIPRGGTRTIQTGIDGYRVIADRTGRYSPGRDPVYSYDEKGGLLSATAYVKKMTPDGVWHDISATAFWAEYSAKTSFWDKMPHNQLAKCAEALALRKAFPAELSGIYTAEEMDQADHPVIEVQKPVKAIEPSREHVNNEMRMFLDQFDARDKDHMREYLEKYSNHWKKTLWEGFSEYSNDPERFCRDFSVWKNKHYPQTKEVV